MQKSAENWPKRGRKVRVISNSGQKFFYIIKPKIDDFIPKLRPPPQKKHPFFLRDFPPEPLAKNEVHAGGSRL